MILKKKSSFIEIQILKSGGLAGESEEILLWMVLVFLIFMG